MVDGAVVDLRREQLAELRSLLRANGLPDDDCDEQGDIFCGIFEAGELVAAGGLEPAGRDALLRSVVVRDSHRAMGYAQRITQYLLRRAEREQRRAVYLLTETAGDYFARLGFVPVERSEVPDAVTRTRQFAALCPQSASCLRLALDRAAARLERD